MTEAAADLLVGELTIGYPGDEKVLWDLSKPGVVAALLGLTANDDDDFTFYGVFEQDVVVSLEPLMPSGSV